MGRPFFVTTKYTKKRKRSSVFSVVEKRPAVQSTFFLFVYFVWFVVTSFPGGISASYLLQPAQVFVFKDEIVAGFDFFGEVVEIGDDVEAVLVDDQLVCFMKGEH